MQIKKIYIKNFKAFDCSNYDLSKKTIVIGENDSGKSTILEALDIIFNQEKIEKNYIRNPEINVEIGILIENNDSLNFIKKVYNGKNGKLENIYGDFQAIEKFSYIYLPSNFSDAKKLISDLTISKFKEILSPDLLKKLEENAKSSSECVLNSINKEILIFDKATTSLAVTSSFKFDSFLKNDIKTNGVPLEGRGSGFRKNIIYALLMNKKYENTILGIDEIENSFSLNNVIKFLCSISEKFMQIVLTTHSTSVVSCVDSQYVLPILDSSSKTVAELLTNLDSSKKRKFVLVEGKTDMKWIKKVLSLLNVESDYIVIQCGGHTNMDVVSDELIKKNFKVFRIKDGDSNDITCSLKKECIELYITLECYNKLFNLSETTLPNTKLEFFRKPNKDKFSEDSIKTVISDHVDEFLNLENEIISEIKNILEIK